MIARLMNSQRWIAHPGHVVPAWTTALRRELIAAYRRGSMDAERCLRSYINQGEPDLLPFEAVVFLAARATIERSEGRAGWTSTQRQMSGPVADDQGEHELAALCQTDCEEMAELIEAGRRFFFPRYQAIG